MADCPFCGAPSTARISPARIRETVNGKLDEKVVPRSERPVTFEPCGHRGVDADGWREIATST